MKKSMTGQAALPFPRFFARWLYMRRYDMLALLLLPFVFWLLVLVVLLVASGTEGGLDDASALAIPTVMALVGSFFAILILSLGDAGASFTMVVGWGHPRRYCVAAAWGCGIFYSAVNLLFAVLLQAVTTGIGALLGVGGSFDLLAKMPPVLWGLLLVAPTAVAVLDKGAVRRFGPKAASVLYLLFLFACIGGSNLVQAVEGPWLSFLGVVFTVTLAAAAVLGSIWLLHAPVGNE